MARPTKYSEKIRDLICERLASGESLRSICADKSMPVISTVLLWVVNDRDGFSEHYARAREAQAHHHVDEMLDMRHGILDGSIEPQAARVVSDMIKWSAERMSRKAFAAKRPDEADDDIQAQPLNISFEVREPVRDVKVTNAKPE